MAFGLALDCSCCGASGILFDYRSAGSTFITGLKTFYEGLGYTCANYVDVRGWSFDLDDWNLIILSLPDDGANDFYTEQWGNLGTWSPSGPKRIAIGTDWRGNGTYEYDASNLTNALDPPDLLVLDDEAGPGSPIITGSTFAAVADVPNSGTNSLTDGVTNLKVGNTGEISDGGSGGEVIAYDGGGTRPWIMTKTVSGISYVVVGSPSFFNQVGQADNDTFYENLATTPVT